jgi:crotonobetainyl-CoA:carnitine CoA-transferase CaiB-like acyl-CoA transferase
MDNAIAAKAYRHVLDAIGLDDPGTVTISGRDPIVPSRHHVGAATAGALAAQGAAVATIWKMRSGHSQSVRVDIARAAVPGLRTIQHLKQNGYPIEVFPRQPSDPVGFFKTKDDRRIYLLRTTVYPHHLVRLLDLLKCGYESPQMALAVAGWKAIDLEEGLAANQAIGVIARGRDEWLKHPQGQWLSARPAVEVEKIADGAPIPFAAAARPLSGIRVLDAAHVLAGPATSRVLAEQGADVLHISAPYQLDPYSMVVDTGFGKRAATIDLQRGADVEQLNKLVSEADIFAQSWRPGSLGHYGFDPAQLAARHPGIIYISVSCYGSGGPCAARGGYEPIGQTACGLAVDEGSADQPKLAPTGTLNDYLAAYLAAAGALGALVRRAKEGGSYHVKVSLTRTSMFIQELGQLSAEEQARMPAQLPQPDPSHMMQMPSPFGLIEAPAPITQYSETQGNWSLPPAPLGTHTAEWLPR